ncbi:MAG: hypothetical protein PHC88_14135 [Terrimicrobiaceae bacterium]|nr:hypothetical protein [Terrimicrobiaceae bacterium]
MTAPASHRSTVVLLLAVMALLTAGAIRSIATASLPQEEPVTVSLQGESPAVQPIFPGMPAP